MEQKLSIYGGKEKIAFLSQGAYGCIFHPGFTCKGKIQSKKYVTKIQLKPNDAEKELEISEYIRKKIRLFRTMFAPIINYCPIQISKIKKDTIQECDLIEDDHKILYSNKIKYVGNKSLEPYLYSCLQQKDDHSFFISQLFETHIYLCNSIFKLINIHVVHYDLKENNILYDDIQHLPIIIDFGLSFRMDLLNFEEKNTYENAFYVFVTKVSWWCLETTIISYITNEEYNYIDNYVKEKEKINDSWIEHIFNVKELLNIVEDYYKYNENIKTISVYWKKKVEISKQKWITYIKKTFQNKTGRFIVENLKQNWETWDLFSISYMYLSFLQNLCMYCLKDYQDFLVDYILDLPFERITKENYRKNIVFFSEKYEDIENIEFDKKKYVENSQKNDLHVSEIESILYSENK